MSEDGRPQGRPFSATRGESFRKQATGCGIAKMRNLMRLWTVAVLLRVHTRRRTATVHSLIRFLIFAMPHPVACLRNDSPRVAENGLPCGRPSSDINNLNRD